MSSERNPFEAVLHFDARELAENRAGRLSARQKQRTLKSAWFLFYFLPVKRATVASVTGSAQVHLRGDMCLLVIGGRELPVPGNLESLLFRSMYTCATTVERAEACGTRHGGSSLTPIPYYSRWPNIGVHAAWSGLRPAQAARVPWAHPPGMPASRPSSVPRVQ